MAAMCRYAKNKSVIVFVYRDGRTYLAKGWWVLRELNTSGYQCTKEFSVPDFKSEDITDQALKEKFDSLPTTL